MFIHMVAVAGYATDLHYEEKIRSIMAANGLKDTTSQVVYERHDAACGGDPQVEYRLFSVFLDQKTRQVASDAGDPVNGTLKVLGP